MGLSLAFGLVSLAVAQDVRVTPASVPATGRATAVASVGRFGRYAIMADGPQRIGLNEVQLGIGLPSEVVETLRDQVPAASLGLIALEGALFTPEEAHRVGLVDEVVGAGVLEVRAIGVATALSVGGAAYAQIKSALRRPALERALATQDAELAGWLDTWFSTPARSRLHAAVARLRK